MAGRFRVQQLSKEGQALIETLYLDDVSLEQIRARLKERTGETIKLSSLHRYCVRFLKRDWRVGIFKQYQVAVLDLMKEFVDLSKSKKELVAFIVAVIGMYHKLIDEKLGEIQGTFREWIEQKERGRDLKAKKNRQRSNK